MGLGATGAASDAHAEAWPRGAERGAAAGGFAVFDVSGVFGGCNTWAVDAAGETDGLWASMVARLSRSVAGLDSALSIAASIPLPEASAASIEASDNATSVAAAALAFARCKGPRRTAVPAAPRIPTATKPHAIAFLPPLAARASDQGATDAGTADVFVFAVPSLWLRHRQCRHRVLWNRGPDDAPDPVDASPGPRGSER